MNYPIVYVCCDLGLIWAMFVHLHIGPYIYMNSQLGPYKEELTNDPSNQETPKDFVDNQKT